MKKYILAFLIVVMSLISVNTVSADSSSEYHYQYNRILKHGSGGNDVVLAKYCLSTINNFYNYEHHGYFDSYTKNMVTAFQMKNGLYVDGVIGPKTGAAMMQQCNAIFESNRNPASTAELDFTFKVRNTSNTNIELNGLKSLHFNLEGTAISGYDLDRKDGYTVDFIDENNKKIRSDRTYSIGSNERISFSVKVSVNAAKTKRGAGWYSLELDSLEWKLKNKSKKNLDMNFISDSVYLVSS